MRDNPLAIGRTPIRGEPSTPFDTRPYTPRTDGKAERLIQTSLREWACARPTALRMSAPRPSPPWADSYNLSRPTQPLRAARPRQG